MSYLLTWEILATVIHPYHGHEQGGGLVYNTLSFKSRGLGVSPGRVIVMFSILYILPFWCLSVSRREA